MDLSDVVRPKLVLDVGRVGPGRHSGPTVASSWFDSARDAPEKMARIVTALAGTSVSPTCVSDHTQPMRVRGSLAWKHTAMESSGCFQHRCCIDERSLRAVVVEEGYVAVLELLVPDLESLPLVR